MIAIKSPYGGIYNIDESKVPPYVIPSPLDLPDGERIRTACEWLRLRRPEILALFQKEVYGWMPPRPDIMKFEVLSQRNDALGGIAVQKEIRIHCAMNNGKSKAFDMLLYYPNNARKPVPVFLALNGRGNHAGTPEQDVRITKEPVINWDKHQMYASEPPEESTRNAQTEFWNFRNVVKRGYASATICVSEIFFDSPDAFPSSIYRLFLFDEELKGEEHDFGAISAWAWGLSRALDCLEHEPALDARKVAVHGHSRLGKAALWAGAYDSRFAMVISNESGCGGASLSRRIFGETIDRVLYFFPHWFSREFQKYRNNEKALTFDQNFLISLIAPRPVYVASAEADLHSDPKGEYLSIASAAEVYRLFGIPCSDFDRNTLPPKNKSIGRDIAYHLRTGEHDVTSFDWNFFLDFADYHFKRE